MTYNEVKTILGAEVLSGERYLSNLTGKAFASDFMSDVLAFATDQTILMTGMLNPQVVRTAQMMDMKCIIFVRGKKPGTDLVQLAENNEMIVMCTEHLMYDSCGLLYTAGLRD